MNKTKIYIMYTSSDKSLILSKIKSHYKFKTNEEFADFLGIAPTTLSSWSRRNSIDTELIYAKCTDIDANWLLTGKGEMIRNVIHAIPDKEFSLKSDRKKDSQEIPIYELLGAASLTTVFQGHPNILGHLKIPNMPKSDGALYVTGDSMYPLLKSGDIAIYRQINDLTEGIVFGEMHIISAMIDGDITTVIKFVQKSEKGEEWVKLVSQNTYHAPRDIKISKIVAAALVKGSVRINSMM